MGKVFTHFPKPGRRFVEDCIYGIQASGDTKLSSIVRAIDDDINPIYTEKRLSRNLADAVLKAGAASGPEDHSLYVILSKAIKSGFKYCFRLQIAIRRNGFCVGSR